MVCGPITTANSASMASRQSSTLPLEVAGPVGAYFQRKLTVQSNGSDRKPVRVDVELSRGIVIRGRVIDSGTGRPLAGRAVCAAQGQSQSG